MSNLVQALLDKYMELQSVLSSGVTSKISDQRAFFDKFNTVSPFIYTLLNINGLTPKFPAPGYKGTNPLTDLRNCLTGLQGALRSLDGNTNIKLPPPPPPGWKPPPGFTPPVTNIKDALTAMDAVIAMIPANTTAPTPTLSSTGNPVVDKTASAATAAAAAQAQAAAKAAKEAAEQQRKSASAATAATAAAAEQQRISTTLSGLKTSLQGVQTAIQGGGGASGSSANPVASVVAALNSVKLSNIPKEVLTNSAKGTVNEAIQMLKQLKEHQKFVSTRVNAAVKAINAAATKKGGSRKNNFNRGRKGGSARKRTRSRR
jgi:uncharacterized spore protein YtfJ